MRKLLYSLLAVLVAMAATACKGDRAEREAEAYLTSKANATKVPQNMGPGSTLTACSYAEKTLCYRIETTPDSLAAINVDKLKSATVTNWKTNLNTQETLEKLRAINASVKYTYVAGTDSLVMTLTADDFK